MSQAGEGSRKPESAKRAGLGREAVIAAAHRSPRRSSLFWWLFDHYDELIEAKGLSALGLPWKSMCAVFGELELSLVGGAPITAERASKTWQRVRKEKARLAALEAKAEAEHAFQRARDPRQNMPSRFSGSFTAPLSDRQPPRVDRRALPLPPPPAPATEVGSGLTVMPGGPVLTGGPEERLPAAEFTIIFEGEPLDLRLFIHPKDDPRPWDLAEFNEEQRVRVMKKHLKMRFESWRTERGGSRNNRIDREWRKRLGKS
jgi:hypothetical protein